MIVCSKFVFLHLHKSGGTFVNQMIANCIPYARQIGYHLPYRELPLGFQRRPVLGTVRNPWSYYVSWYHFQACMDNPNALFRIMSNDNTLDFTGTVTNLVRLHEDPERVAALAQRLPDEFLNHGLNLTRECINAISGSGLGFFAFLYQRLYQGAREPVILKMESLRDSLKVFLEQYAVEPSARLNAFIDQTPRLNTSQHGDYRTYYTAPLKRLIEEADSMVIDTHEYTFGDRGVENQ
jgi:hypothetical protein